MSNAERVAIEEAHTPADGAGPSGRRIALAAGLTLLLVCLGYMIGVRSSWTAHHPSVVDGMAERVPADVPYAYFDPEGGGRVGFRLDDVVWKASEEIDSGSIPPCLREPGDRVPVQAGVIEVARPYGSGSYQQVLSVTCPD